METWEPRDPGWEARVRSSFDRQQMIRTLKGRLTDLSPGRTEISAPFLKEFGQQHGFLHAGVVTTLLDSACGFAALTLLPPGAGVLAVEFKVNLLRPVTHDVVARGIVLRPGSTINACRGEAYVQRDGQEVLVAAMLSSVMTVSGRSDVVG